MTTWIKHILVPLLVVTASCVDADEFDRPDLTVPEVQIEGTLIEIDALYSLWEQELTTTGNQFLNFDETTDLYTFGYVVSSDEAGNFFEELIIQNAANAPKRGVKLLLDVNPLFSYFEFGRKVFIKLNGLSVGLNGGVLSLGVKRANAVDKIAESQLEGVLIRDAEVATIEPLPLPISDFSQDKTNLFIRLSDVQFNRSEVVGENRKTFAAEPTDQFDGERVLESCTSGEATVLSSSTFSDFKAVLLPQGQGTIDAILGMDYFGERFNVVINDPSSIDFTNAERCDPDTYVCDAPSGGGSVVYQENFEQSEEIEDYENLGWTNVNVSGGNTIYQISSFGNNNYAQITGYQAGDAVIQTWLVSPGIDMDSTTMEELSFDIQASYDNGTILSVFFSTDFSGDVEGATWWQLDANIPSGPEDSFGDFETVGPINIACIEGVANFAFLYSGSDPDATTRYHIDNIDITGN